MSEASTYPVGNRPQDLKVSASAWVSENKLLILERSDELNIGGAKLILADFTNATDVSGLPIAQTLALEDSNLNLAAVGGLLPDRTFLIAVPPEDAAARKQGELDRIEREGPAFAAEVDRAYRELARIFAQRVVVVDGTQNAEDIAEVINGQLRDVS